MKILYITTIGRTMSFFKAFIRKLMDEGHTVEIATNENNAPIPEVYREWGCKINQIDFSRSPLAKGNLKAFNQLSKIIKNEKYDIVHCHTPNASAVARLVCRKYRKKTGLKVFYTAHGFHFYKGAPLKNWLLYYPIEKICARFTDKLITINTEDYELAKAKFKAKEVCYVPGVGVDISRFENVQVDRKAKREEIGVPEDAFLLLSVGELNENKNHQVIIKALAKVNNPDIHYAIAGRGNKKEHLLELAKELGVSDNVHLLGFRNDIPELNYIADAFCLPSFREGLGLAAIEAMACGLPIITSNVHGINDYSVDGVTGFKCAPDDVDGFVSLIKKLMGDVDLKTRVTERNKELAKKYSLENVNPLINEIYLI